MIAILIIAVGLFNSLLVLSMCKSAKDADKAAEEHYRQIKEREEKTRIFYLERGK